MAKQVAFSTCYEVGAPPTACGLRKWLHYTKMIRSIIVPTYNSIDQLSGLIAKGLQPNLRKLLWWVGADGMCISSLIGFLASWVASWSKIFLSLSKLVQYNLDIEWKLNHFPVIASVVLVSYIPMLWNRSCFYTGYPFKLMHFTSALLDSVKG